MKWEPKNTPGSLINRAGRLIGRVADVRLKPLGVAAGQVPILAWLHDKPAMTQSALARLIQIEQPTMAATLSRMERDGLIERRPDAADGRSSLINLTPLAVAKVPDVLAVLNQGRDEMLAGLDDAEQKLLVELLLRVIANLEAAVRKIDDATATA